jgi:hypothetical protein
MPRLTDQEKADIFGNDTMTIVGVTVGDATKKGKK